MNSKKSLNVKKAGIVTTAVVVVVAAGFAIYSHLPFVKVNKAIAAGNKYTESADYEAAISSYEKAIEIDPTSVAAYSNLAGAYLSLDNKEAAKETLLSGYENTENEYLIKDYRTLVLNEAVSDMNSASTDFDTVKKILTVLSEDGQNEDALNLLDSAYERCFSDSYNYDVNALFRGEYCESAEGKTGSFEEYSEVIKTMLSAYDNYPSEHLKNIILKYSVPASDSFTISTQDVVSYNELIAEVTGRLGSDQAIDSVKECLTDSQEVLGIFTDIFTQLDVGNVDELRDFIVSDDFITLRNKFLHGEETPQENTTYVAISREAIIINKNEDSYSYRFLNFDENTDTQGVITVWANFFEDDGIQRNSISYEPASVGGEYFPHTKYSVTYLYSYITSGKSTKVAKMNYRLDTTISLEDGTTDETIVGDWGGPNEWIMDIDTIESRIRA